MARMLPSPREERRREPPVRKSQQVVERRFRTHEAQLEQATRRVVDVDQQRATGPAVLEPLVVAAVDLDQLGAEAVAPPPWPLRRSLASSTQRLDRRAQAMHLSELLASQRGADLGVQDRYDAATWSRIASGARLSLPRGFATRPGAPAA